MGTPDFAVQSLKRLIEEGCNVVGVVTMPDKAIGRHHDVLQSSPVKKFAQEKGIPVLQPEKLRDEAFLAKLRTLEPDLQIVVAFRMLPQVVGLCRPLAPSTSMQLCCLNIVVRPLSTGPSSTATRKQASPPSSLMNR